jgi:hypothetical protein
LTHRVANASKNNSEEGAAIIASPTDPPRSEAASNDSPLRVTAATALISNGALIQSREICLGFQMRPRFSILNLLLLTCVVGLVIVVFRTHCELRIERSLRIQLLQKGGILEVTDPNVVQVSSRYEWQTLRWRVYVPEGRNVTLNARLDAMPMDKPVAPRLPPNAIVVPDRAPSNPMTLGPGEHVVTLACSNEGPYLTLEVVGDEPRRGRVIRPAAGDILWYRTGYHENLTQIEHTPSTGAALMNGQTAVVADGKTFVVCRFRDPAPIVRQNQLPSKDVGEVLVWLHPDDG